MTAKWLINQLGELPPETIILVVGGPEGTETVPAQALTHTTFNGKPAVCVDEKIEP